MNTRKKSFGSRTVLAIFPGFCLTLTVVGTDQLGGAVRDRFDPPVGW